MKTVSVLIVVDTEGALASGTASDNAYMVDTNGFLGSWQEGTDALHTICEDGQTIVWSVTSVSAESIVSITGFSGQMVSSSVCSPSKHGLAGESFWSGLVETHGAFSSFPYTLTLSVQGKQMNLNAFLKTV